VAEAARRSRRQRARAAKAGGGVENAIFAVATTINAWSPARGDDGRWHRKKIEQLKSATWCVPVSARKIGGRQVMRLFIDRADQAGTLRTSPATNLTTTPEHIHLPLRGRFLPAILLVFDAQGERRLPARGLGPSPASTPMAPPVPGFAIARQEAAERSGYRTLDEESKRMSV